MLTARGISAVIVALAAVLALAVTAPAPVFADTMHKCDAVTEEGWSVVPEREVLRIADGAPYRDGGDWYVDRVTTVLPFCNYYNSIGIYSLNSYSLTPIVTEERIAICRASAGGATVAVPPYAGPCPPP